QTPKSVEMEVYRPWTELAASRKGEPAPARPAQYRPQKYYRGAHLAHKRLAHRESLGAAGVYNDGATLSFAPTAQRAEYPAGGIAVRKCGTVMYHALAAAQIRRRQHRERAVF